MRPQVWAPTARTVALRVAGTADRPMRRGPGGWWRSEVDLLHGDRYGFVLDGATTPVPDPRSRWQPEGVHELSATFDPAAHAWHDDAWRGRALAGAVLYELHVGTFTEAGTLDSAIDHLDHLVELGVDLVELLPVNAFNGTHNWGYDGVLWYAVHEGYGGPAAYQRFVDAAHRRGLGVVQDVVYNHLGPSGNYLPRFGPYLDESSAGPWGAAVNLAEPEVRRYVLDNASMWLRDYHVDALRLDAVHALVDTSEPHLLQELARQTDALSAELGRPLTLIAESDLNDPRMITPRPEGHGITAQWSDDYHHAVHVALTGETDGYYADFASLGSLAKAATRGFFHDGTYSSFRGRAHGRPIHPDTPAWRLVTFDQDHDQVGNRAQGDRLSQSLDHDLLAIGAVLTLMMPFTPMLFMGEEWGASTPWQFFTSHPEPELAEATARGRIAEFARMGWDPALVPDPQDLQTFLRSKLDWSEVHHGDHGRLLTLYRALIALRRERPELWDAGFRSLSASYSDEDRWFRLDRARTGSGDLSVLVNLGDRERGFAVAPETRVLLATSSVASAGGRITLPARSAAVVGP